jgi:thioredoxin-like negative regulator of GroEL
MLAACAPLAAQEPTGIKWRTNYHEARKEAEAKKLPVLIDFVRPNCQPCLRMEQYTFADPRIVKTLNTQFIPLKINGQDDSELASRLQINLFPTLVLATPDGRIANTLVGFQEADVLNEQLTRVVASLKPADTRKQDFEAAAKWEKAGDYPRAINALRSILDDEKARPLHKESQELMAKIEKNAAAQVARAKDLHGKGQTLEAMESLADVRRLFAGSKVSKEAGDLINALAKANTQVHADHRNKRVRELLTQAKDFYKSKDYIPCLDRCELILANYGDLPEGQQAFMLASEIKNNPEWLQAAADVMTDRLGGMYLALADSYLKRGQLQRARFYLERVMQAFPGSRMAESAQIRLTQLQASMPALMELQGKGP